MSRKSKVIDAITLTVIAELIYLLGYYLLWLQTRPGNVDQCLKDWNDNAVELGLRRKPDSEV